MYTLPARPPTTIEAKNREWRTILVHGEKADCLVAINRALNLPDDATPTRAGHAIHVTDGREPAEQAAAYFDAYVALLAERAGA